MWQFQNLIVSSASDDKNLKKKKYKKQYILSTYKTCHALQLQIYRIARVTPSAAFKLKCLVVRETTS